MLGNKFSVVDFTETHNMFYYDLWSATVSPIAAPRSETSTTTTPDPAMRTKRPSRQEREKALRGEPSEALERAVREAVAAIEEDGAEVITFGCSDVFWMQSFLQKRLNEMGWEIPVLEGYSCAIVLAKLFVDLGWMPAGLLFRATGRSSGEGKKSFEEDRLFFARCFSFELSISLLLLVGSSFLAHLLGIDGEGSLMATLGIGQRHLHILTPPSIKFFRMSYRGGFPDSLSIHLLHQLLRLQDFSEAFKQLFLRVSKFSSPSS